MLRVSIVGCRSTVKSPRGTAARDSRAGQVL